MGCVWGRGVGGGSYGGMEEWRSVSGGTLQQLLFASCGTELLTELHPQPEQHNLDCFKC